MLIYAIILVALILIACYGWISFPIMTGFSAKQMCTCTFVSEREQDDIESNELGFFPVKLVKNQINLEEQSVTSSLWGLSKKKAFYRKGIGCTLINSISEEELKSQVFSIPRRPESAGAPRLWPYGDDVSYGPDSSIDIEKLRAAVDTAFTEPNRGKKQRTRAVVVVYDGKLIAEKYAPGYSVNSKMYGWSMAKSVTAALIGILVKEGKLDVTKPAPVTEWKDLKDPRNSITLEHLLQQTSGLNFLEEYTRSSDVTDMLYKHDDMAAFAAAHLLSHPPGTFFNYSSGNSNILSRIVKKSVGEKEYAAFPFNALFYKLGMYNTLLEPDASGMYVGSSYIMSTARDYARFGLLYYNDGVWNGERILPEGWVKKTKTFPESNPLKNYGYQFWINGFDKNQPSKIKYPDVPLDMFYCDGFGYQGIYIIPTKKLVIVRLGLTLDESFDENNFLKNILESIK